MEIKDGWKIRDGVLGLSIEVKKGKELNKIHIESLDGNMNRDFYFTPEGEFDGTGSAIPD